MSSRKSSRFSVQYSASNDDSDAENCPPPIPAKIDSARIKRRPLRRSSRISGKLQQLHGYTDQSNQDIPDTPESLGEDSGQPECPSYVDFTNTDGLHPVEGPFNEDVCKNLKEDLQGYGSSTSDSTVDTLEKEASGNEEDDDKVGIFLRVRPAPPNVVVEKPFFSIDDETTLSSVECKKTVRNKVVQTKTTFKFSKIFSDKCTQSKVFDICISPLLKRFCRRKDSLIFNYGTTNSGKTFTMQGFEKNEGIIPRTLGAICNMFYNKLCTVPTYKPADYNSWEHLPSEEFNNLEAKRDKIISGADIKQNMRKTYQVRSSSVYSISGPPVDFARSHVSDVSYQYSLWVSYVELYNNKVYDLFDLITKSHPGKRKDLKIISDSIGRTYFKGITEFPVTSEDQAYKLFLAGQKNLQFGSTRMNQTSSRSHSFFTIRVISGLEGVEECRPDSVHRMTFCDLAGSERAKQTENKGDQLFESNNINKSLLVLMKMIRQLKENKFTAFGGVQGVGLLCRDSKLGQIFKSYFNSSTHVHMIVNISPDPALTESTLNVLKNSAVVNEVVFQQPEVQQPSIREIVINKKRAASSKLVITKKTVTNAMIKKKKRKSRGKSMISQVAHNSDDSASSKVEKRSTMQIGATENFDDPAASVITPIAAVEELKQAEMEIDRLEKENKTLRALVARQKEHLAKQSSTISSLKNDIVAREIEKQETHANFLKVMEEEKKAHREIVEKCNRKSMDFHRLHLENLVKINSARRRRSSVVTDPPVVEIDEIDEPFVENIVVDDNSESGEEQIVSEEFKKKIQEGSKTMGKAMSSPSLKNVELDPITELSEPSTSVEESTSEGMSNSGIELTSTNATTVASDSSKNDTIDDIGDSILEEIDVEEDGRQPHVENNCMN